MNDLPTIQNSIAALSDTYRDFIIPYHQNLHLQPPKQPNRRFTILLIGNQNAGKSSFINHCIQQKLLKTGHGQTTQNISFVVPGASRQTLSITQASTLIPFTGVPQTATVEIFDGYSKQNLVSNSAFLSQISTIFEVENQPKSICPFMFIDTPGIITEKTDFQTLKNLAQQVDLVLFFVESAKFSLGEKTNQLLNHIIMKQIRMKILLTKIDLAGSKFEYVQNVVQASQLVQRAVQFREFDVFPICMPKFCEAKVKVQEELNNSNISLERLNADFLISNFDCLRDLEQEMESQVLIEFRELIDRFQLDCIQLNEQINNYEVICKRISKFNKKIWFSRIVLIGLFISLIGLKMQKNYSKPWFNYIIIFNLIQVIISFCIWKKPIVGMEKINEMESLVQGNLMKSVERLQNIKIE